MKRDQQVEAPRVRVVLRAIVTNAMPGGAGPPVGYRQGVRVIVRVHGKALKKPVRLGATDGAAVPVMHVPGHGRHDSKCKQDNGRNGHHRRDVSVTLVEGDADRHRYGRCDLARVSRDDAQPLDRPRRELLRA